MKYGDLNDLARKFLKGDHSSSNKSDILSILESIQLSSAEDKKKVEIVKGLIREVERQNQRLIEANTDLANNLNEIKG
jgi:hypothetical protein